MRSLEHSRRIASGNSVTGRQHGSPAAVRGAARPLPMLVALALLAASALSAQPRVPFYHLIDLGTLGGSRTYATGINNSGEVVGHSFLTGDGAHHAFRYSAGVMTDLGTLGGTSSRANAINDAGQIVGESVPSAGASLRAFLYSDGLMTNLGTLDPLGGGFSTACALNEVGQVVGYCYIAGNGSHAFLYSGGTMADLGTLGGTYSFAKGINFSGQIVGQSSLPGDIDRAFLYAAGNMTDLGTLGGTESGANGINDTGQIVGYSYLAGDGSFHACLYSGGSMTDLGTLGGKNSSAVAINSTGQVVGNAYLAGDLIRCGFLYVNGTMYNLNSRVSAGAGFQYLEEATGINDAGEVCGNAVYGVAPYRRACKLVPNALPVAQPDSYTTYKSVALDVPAVSGLLSNDSDSDAAPYGETLSAVRVTSPAHGTLDPLGSDGSFTYTPSAGYVGEDSFTYRVSDGLESGETAVVTVNVTNRAPSLPTALVVAPSDPVCTDTLRATADGATDGDGGDAVSYKYQWALATAGGEPPAWGHDSTDGALAGVTLHKGEVWRVRACATDGVADSAWTEPAQVTIADAAPLQPTVVRVRPSVARAGTPLSGFASGSSDADGEAVRYLFQWRRSVDSGETWEAWGYSGKVLAVTTVKGERWQTRARSSAAGALSIWRESAPLTVGDRPPAAPAAVAITPTGPTTGEALRASAAGATDPDGDAVGYVFQWRRSPDGGTTWGAWGFPARVLSVTTVRGEGWQARARARAAGLTSAWHESAAVTVRDAPPSAPLAVAITPVAPAADRDLRATASGTTDPDGDSCAYLYQWNKSSDGGTIWSGWVYNGRVLPHELTGAGEQWKARARGVSGLPALRSGWTESATVTILPSAAASAPAVSVCGTAGGRTQITVRLSVAARVQVRVLNLAGQEVALLSERSLEAGMKALLWNGRSTRGTPAPPGHYLLEVTARQTDGTRRRTVAAFSR